MVNKDKEHARIEIDSFRGSSCHRSQLRGIGSRSYS